MKAKTELCFDTYIRHLSALPDEELLAPEAYSADSLLGRISLFSACVPFVLNYKTMSYTYFGSFARSMVGQPAEAFYEGGWEFTSSIWDPKDLRIFKEFIFRDNLHFFREPEGDPVIYRTNYNFRVKTIKGDLEHIHQQSTMLYSRNGTLPVASFGTVMDITPFKSDSRIVHKVERLLPNGEWQAVMIKYYFPDISSEELLSKTEIEVLKWVVEGYSSQEIADRLHRSLHTIKTHRKNIFGKTNSGNVAELLKYAKNNGLI